MPADFWKLWTSSAVTNLGDGITMVAGPLLVASITDSPAAVAGAVFAQQLPWLLFALVSGAWADRLDRRKLVVTVNLMRAVALGGLAVAVGSGAASVPLIYAVFFLLGTGETLADTASSAFVPALVPAERRPVANSLLYANFNVLNQFAAKPLGAWLFVVAAAVPFGVNALTFALAAALVAAIRSVPPPEKRPPARLRTDIAEGVRWLARHRLLRTLALTMAVGNVVFSAAFAVFVLYAEQRLGVSDVGYGVLLVAFAVGGLLGTLVAPTLIRRLGSTALLRAGLLIEVALHATLALTREPVVAAAMIVVFGVHTTIWGVVVTTIRQRDVPSSMFGRIASVYAFLDLGGAAVGSLVGGAVATAYGLVATYWTAAAAMALVAVAAWRPMAAGDAAPARQRTI
ncbi:MFS transporter [Paractinoplanes atraurantiacus]|uniref:Predicted arabinose efflux permease, MFS family n=1 Tax=Paractinoplanes atraurantiacus TaxID=1036182 RepID=A0A285JTB6_9ACTN|nr:MFS transporter [Actinoplanes atraurantiacus]SNY62576.1 Predicted arabinose efflux permease, MFS family [Actinoplanes atraurantiacus]